MSETATGWSSVPGDGREALDLAPREVSRRGKAPS